jgi:hypothetical protein
LLKDGDASPSRTGVEFHDGAVATLKQAGVAALGFWRHRRHGLISLRVYQRVRPAAETYLREARQLAERVVRRGCRQVRRPPPRATPHRTNSRSKSCAAFRVSGRTRQHWSRAQSAMAKSAWTQVSRDLGLIMQASKKEPGLEPKAAWKKRKMADAK